MGLLTDTKQRQVLMRGIVKYHEKLSLLFYIVGVVWFLALAYQPLNAGTYFSENALLPGLVESDLPHGFHSLSSYMKLLKVEMNKDKTVVPKEWIFKEFQNLGLDTYRHNFTIKYPFKMAINQDLGGENIFAILRAHRAASTEALVMTAPLRAVSHPKTPTDGSVALMLALAAQFRNNPYWSKDVIFLLSEFEETGVHAWLDAYHETKTPYVIAEDLPGRSGAIQAAINLELPSDKIRYLNMKLEGLNGQLPNLDLFNLAIRLSRRERVPATLHHRYDPQDQESLEGYQHMLGTMLQMMWTQASGAPSGNHGLFHRFHIEALTVEGVHKQKGHRSYPLEQIARVVEGIFRSLNNLLERFHQSFFFYLLPSTDRYISIGIYMPPFGLIATAGVIKALALWIITHTAEQDKNDQSASEKNEKTADSGESKDTKEKAEDENHDPTTTDDVKAKGDAGDEEDKTGLTEDGEETEENQDDKLADEEGKEDTAEELMGEDSDLDDEDLGPMPSTGLLSVLPTLMMAYLLGLMAYTAPYILTQFTPAIKMKAADTILYGILAIFSAGLAYPYLMNRKASPEDEMRSDWQLLKCVGLIVQGLTLFAVSLMNISLAFFLAAVSVPVTMMVRPTKSIILRTLQQVALLAVSPAGLLFTAAVVNTAWQSEGGEAWYWVVWASVDEAKQMLFLLLVDHYLFCSWTYTLASFAFLPTWLLFWAVPFCDP